MSAAIEAAENGNEVTILEHTDRVGKKILLTGNGRCNLLNEALKEEPWEAYPFADSAFLKEVFSLKGYEDAFSFLEDMGLRIKSRNGLLYPYSDEAGSVVNAFLSKLKSLGVEIKTGISPQKIIPKEKGNKEGGFTVLTDGGKFDADRVILASGGRSYPKTGSDGTGYALAESLGHKVNPVRPGLVKLICAEDYYMSVAGVRVHAKLTLISDGKEIRSEEGELQLTGQGISGIAVMNLSNRLGTSPEKAKVKIDLMPELSYKEAEEMLIKRKEILPGEAAFFFNGLLPKKLGALCLKLCGIRASLPVKEITTSQICKITDFIKGWTVEIRKTGSFEEAQITLGGIDTADVKPDMESRLIPGLFFAGEILDLHGDCGGYNLGLAFITGILAGSSASLR